MPDDLEPADFDRTQEEDHDLLTFGEVGLRIVETLAELRDQASTANGADLAALESRIQALENAAARNKAQAINDENFEKFFGYPGRARRNTTW